MPPAEATAARIRGYLDELGIEWERTDNGTVKVEAGTTAVYITSEQHADRCVVSLLAPVLSDVDATADQLAELLKLNAQLNFGKFSWHAEERTLTVDYELLGDFLDRDELGVAVEAV